MRICPALLLAAIGSALALAPGSARAANVVAKVKVHNPANEPLDGVIVRGMLPLPEGYEKGISWLALRDGTKVLLTQQSVFSTYPGSEKKFPVGRPEVVQLIARVDLPANTFKQLDVVEIDPGPPTDTAPELLKTGLSAWLRGKRSVVVEATDCYGNVYAAEPLKEGQLAQVLCNGPLLGEQVYQATMTLVGKPDPARPALKKFLRVRAYLTLYDREQFASLALMIHNGSIDNPNGNVYYRSIRVGIRKPLLARVWHRNFSPAADGAWTEDKEQRWLTCPPPHRGGKVFVMPHGGAAVLRMTIYHPSVEKRARQFHQYAPVFVPVPSQELWSWSNFKTARYDSPKYPMPLRLDIAGVDRRVKKTLASPTLGWPLVYLRQRPKPSYRTLGHAMPAGVQYGGMTGGQGINFVFGATAAVTGHQGAVKLHVLMADRNFDRQRVHLFYDDGAPFTYGRHVVTVGGKKYLDINYNHRGFHVLEIRDPACKVQADHVKGDNLLSEQGQRLLKYHNHDHQHLSRVFDAVPAAYLACDPVNRDRLVTLGAQMCWKLNLHPIKKMPRFGGWGSLFGLKKHVDARPHRGIGVSREHGWMLHALGWAHAISQDKQIRADCVAVAKTDVYVLGKAQLPAGNVTVRHPSGRAFKGQYWFTTGWEEGAIIPNGARCVAAILSSPENEQLVKQLKQTYARVGKWVVTKGWSRQAGSPGFHIALMKKGEKTPLAEPMAKGGCAFYMGTPVTWYYELTGKQIYLDRLKEMAGKMSLLDRAKRGLGNWSYALWLAQGGVIPGREQFEQQGAK